METLSNPQTQKKKKSNTDNATDNETTVLQIQILLYLITHFKSSLWTALNLLAG